MPVYVETRLHGKSKASVNMGKRAMQREEAMLPNLQMGRHVHS